MKKKNIILTAVGSSGDIHPMIALGRELQVMGHHPILAVNNYFQKLVEQNGLPFVQLGVAEDYLRSEQNPDLWHPTKSFEVIVEEAIGPCIRPLYDILTAFDPADTIVVSSGLMYGARIAHEKLGLPWVTVHLQPSVFRSFYDTPIMGNVALPEWLPHWFKRGYFNLLDVAVIDRLLGKKVNPLREEMGLPPQSQFFGETIHAPQKSIGLFPAWFAAPQPDWPPQIELTGFVRYDRGETAVLSPTITDFLVAGEPPLVFTAGSAMHYGQPFFQTSAAAAQRLGRRAILVSRSTDQFPAHLPDTILPVTYVPFSLLLPHAAALVHHGGIGTVAQALAAGVPQLVMPMSHDQPDNARRLERLGVGATLPPKQYQETAVADQLTKLLQSPKTRQQCTHWAQQVNFDHALAQTCRAIVSL